MTLYDSSVLIDYLAGSETAVEYVEAHLEDRAFTVPMALFEVYQGEVFKSGSADFGAVDGALSWVTVVDETPELARAAAELQAQLERDGDVLAARDAYVAGGAVALEEPLAVADEDFDVRGLTERIEVDFV